MPQPKYIVFDEIIENFLTISMPMIIFPSFINHKTIANKFYGNPISAGFIDLKNSTCSGESVGLKIESNPEIDNLLLKNQYNL